MKKNIIFNPNSSAIISLVLILFGTGTLDLCSSCYAQSPWTTKSPMTVERWELSTCAVDGKIYAIGGAGPVYQALRTVEEYDPATDTWTTKSEMSTARQGLSTSVVNGKIYAIGGGSSSSSSYSSVVTFSTVEEYDPATDTWTTKSPMPTSRGFHSANVVDGKIYVIGGSHDSEPDGNHIRTVEVYDPATDTSWTQKGEMPRGIGAGFSSVVVGKIYVFGGYGGPRSVHEYDPATDTWTMKSPMPTARHTLSTSVVDGKIYVIGGYVPGVSGYPGLTAVEVYDPATDTWTTASDMPTGRFGPRTSVVDGKIYVIGGQGWWIGTAYTTVEEYDPHLDLLLLVETTNLDKSYAKAGIDSVWITTEMNDPTGVTLLAIIEAPDQTPVDSLQLFNDGNHNDGNAGDNLYANVWPVSSAEEQNYYVDLEVTRIDADTAFLHINNVALFTTIGPVTLENYNFVSSSDTVFNPGDRIEITLTLKNNGSADTAPNIETKIISLDTLVSVSEWYRGFGDLTPGEDSTSSYYRITISEMWTGISQVPILVEITSNDYAYWIDTFYITVVGPTSIEDIKEPIARIYPNPANGVFNVEINNTGNQEFEIEIITVTGRIIYRKDYKNIITHFIEQIDLSGYSKGIYLVRIKQTNNVYVGIVVLK